MHVAKGEDFSHAPHCPLAPQNDCKRQHAHVSGYPHALQPPAYLSISMRMRGHCGLKRCGAAVGVVGFAATAQEAESETEMDAEIGLNR